MLKISLILLATHTVCSADWFIRKSPLKDNTEVSLRFEKKVVGHKTIASALENLRQQGKLGDLTSISFPNLIRNPEYQNRIKSALLKLAPEEAKKVFANEELKSWRYYNKLEESLIDAFCSLDEFKNVRQELKKYGFNMGRLRAEKFGYSKILGGGEAQLHGYFPFARLSLLPPDIGARKFSTKVKSYGRSVVKIDGNLWLKLSVSSVDNKKFKMRGYWSSELKHYIASDFEVFELNVTKWKRHSMTLDKRGRSLTFNGRGLSTILVPIKTSKEQTCCVVLNSASGAVLSERFRSRSEAP